MIRPADANEAIEAWKSGGFGWPHGADYVPTESPVLSSAGAPVGAGAYVLQKPTVPSSPLSAPAARCRSVSNAAPAGQGVSARVVSFPSWELFADADADTRRPMRPELPPGGRGRCCAGLAQVGRRCGVDRFRASAPGGTVMRELGINVDNVVARARTLIGHDVPSLLTGEPMSRLHDLFDHEARARGSTTSVVAGSRAVSWRGGLRAACEDSRRIRRSFRGNSRFG